jgi:hypothetical protein
VGVLLSIRLGHKVVKYQTRKSSRKRTQQDYANLNSGIQSDPHRWVRVLESKGVPEANFERMHGSQVGLEWLNGDENAMREPIIIESAEGLGMKMPNSNITIRNIAESIGEDLPVEVIGTPTVDLMVTADVRLRRRCFPSKFFGLDSGQVG